MSDGALLLATVVFGAACGMVTSWLSVLYLLPFLHRHWPRHF